jgi:hypothetical protein
MEGIKMYLTKFFTIPGLVIFMAASIAFAKCEDKNFQSSLPKVRVQIQIVADSSNVLEADVEVEAGMPARDLMDRLFKMSYVDYARRFVNGIAGFKVGPREKKFWRLEIDGKDSEVGIAEIKISKPMQIKWTMTAIK